MVGAVDGVAGTVCRSSAQCENIMGWQEHVAQHNRAQGEARTREPAHQLHTYCVRATIVFNQQRSQPQPLLLKQDAALILDVRDAECLQIIDAALQDGTLK